jgi:hypothetical protein
MNAHEYHIKHAGWLLACDSWVLIAKGERKLAELCEVDKHAALKYKNECLDVYVEEKI